jgi:hypothetical protein
MAEITRTPKSPGSSGGSTYWYLTQRPLSCLAFLIPLLSVYEFGVLWLGGMQPELLRNGADSWLRWILDQLGFSSLYMLPAVIVLVFVVWHISTREPWRLDCEVLGGMFAESLALALVLVIIGRLQDKAFAHMEATRLLSMYGGPNAGESVICYLGAGIYEETLFRLLLLPAVYYGLKGLAVPSPAAMTMAMTASALTFAAAHYVGPLADSFLWYTFIFRWLAGLFFAGVFVLRGFGIAVGAHAAYDILVGVLGFRL